MSSRNSTIIIGGLVGAVLGATAGWAWGRSQERQLSLSSGKSLHLKAGAPEFVKLGMSLLGVVRQVFELFKPG